MLSKLKSWAALSAHYEDIKETSLNDLFEADKNRFSNFSEEIDGLFLDYSKNNISKETFSLLLDLAIETNIESARDEMFSGERINTTEGRAVLHTALRRPMNDEVQVNRENIAPFIHEELRHMKEFSDKVRSGTWKGATGKRITHIVNIGIGGSDLGPVMVYEALKNKTEKLIPCRFVSNVDGAHLEQALKDLSPETTLFIVASKSFTTQETMANAEEAKAWLLGALNQTDAVSKHFVALSTNMEAVKAFGIEGQNMFPFGDWVGGRYSVWSTIGLSLCLSLGYDHFEKMIEGGRAMDQHFQSAPLDKNIPVLLALLGVWYRNFYEYGAVAVLPYAQDLHRFTAYLQQMDMESNGKAVTKNNEFVDYETGPLIFGEPGTNGQHAFYQLIHQGTSVIPCDFIGVRKPLSEYHDHHEKLLANMVAQSQALMLGRKIDEVDGNPHKVFSGNRPSNTIILECLDAYHLGLLIALYEHKVFVQGVLWGINSFDQWGVELGKILANKILDNDTNSTTDGSTQGLCDYLGL